MRRLIPTLQRKYVFALPLGLLISACLSDFGHAQEAGQYMPPQIPSVQKPQAVQPTTTPSAIRPSPQPAPASTAPGTPASLQTPDDSTVLSPPVTPSASSTSAPMAQPLPTGKAAQADATPTDVTPLEQAPITMYDEKVISEGSALLNKVLTGTVVKIQEFPIDLPTVLKLVETQNLLLERDRLGSKIQSNLYYRSLSELLPDLQGTYNQSRFQGVVQVFGSQTVPVYQTRIVPQLTARWTIYPGGQDIFNSLAARQRAIGAKAQVVSTLQDQLTLAANEYYQLLAAGIQVANINLSIQEVQGQVDLNEARVKAGVGTKLDLERARSQLVAREQALIIAENDLAKAQQALLNRLNLDPSVGLVPPKVVAQPRPLVPLSVTTEQLVGRAIQNNPNLKITQSEIEALKWEGRAVLSRLLPAVTLQTYINGTGPEIDKLGLGRFGGIALQADLLDNLGTSIPLDYRTKRLQVKQQTVQKLQQVRDIQSEVINAYLDSRASAKSVFAAQEQLAVAQEAYRLAFGRFRAGLGINVDVLDAQTTLRDARTVVVRAILDFNQAQVRLLDALGEVSTPNILNGMKPDAFIKPAALPKK
ncbi:MAG: TolC family protein [Vampirovibrio sp.]|jgi:outer membrane protein TolC|nr:TolC family protein [Vampirovibrio sp.]